MKYLKWLKWSWIVLSVATITYSIYIYIDNGFSWIIVAQLLIVLGAGPSVFYNPPTIDLGYGYNSKRLNRGILCFNTINYKSLKIF